MTYDAVNYRLRKWLKNESLTESSDAAPVTSDDVARKRRRNRTNGDGSVKRRRITVNSLDVIADECSSYESDDDDDDNDNDGSSADGDHIKERHAQRHPSLSSEGK